MENVKNFVKLFVEYLQIEKIIQYRICPLFSQCAGEVKAAA